MNHWKRVLILLGGLAVAPALTTSAADSRAKTDAPPNILMILVDDLGYGDLSGQGAPDIRTPAIDELGAAGMKFSNFYANCPVCSPTRAALLTGRYPDLVGVPGVIRTHADNSWGYLATNATLLPRHLKAAGYHTAIVGKWHLGLQSPNTPLERGFDFFHGFLGDMMDDYYDHRRHGRNYMRRNDREIDPSGHATDLFTDWAIDYLRECGEEKRRFFLYLAYNAPHTPIQPPEDWLEKVKRREPGLAEPRAKLAALIEHLDQGVGRVLAALRESGLADRTLVLFTSDNGGQLDVGARCGPFRGGKQDTYEGGLRVPFCAVWPGRIPAGRQSDAVALTMDLFPTILEAAGLPAPERIEGLSILPILTGQSKSLAERDLFWMRREGGGRYRGQDYYAMRRGLWKLVQNHPFEPYQLYNLAQDPRETTDVSAHHRDRVLSMNQALQRHIQQAGAIPWQE